MHHESDREPLFSRWLLVILFLGYFIVWLLPRYESIDQNVRFFDDYLRVSEGRPSTADPCRFPAKDYRWIFDAGMCLAEEHAPEFLDSSGPKLLAGGGLALFSLILCLCMRHWRFPIAISASVPIPFLSHPIINDVSLWNIVGPGGMILALCAFCYLIVERRQSTVVIWWAVSLLLVVLFTAELYLIVFILLAASELGARASSGQRLDFIEAIKKSSIFLLLTTVYLLSRWAAEAWFGAENIIARGMVSGLSMSEFLSTKYQAVTNVLSNVYATPLSQFFSIESALSSWRWVALLIPILVGSAAYIRTKSLVNCFLYTVYAGLLLLLPTALFLVTGQNPTAWRVSVPSLIALMIVVAIAQNLIIAKRADYSTAISSQVAMVLAVVFNLGLAAVWSVSSKAESDLRVVEFRLENQFLSDIKALNSSSNRASVLLEIDVQSETKSVETLEASKLNVAYVHRGLNLSLDQPFSWRGKLRDHGFEPVELIAQPKAKYSQRVLELCDQFPKLNCRFGYEKRALAQCREMPVLLESTLGLQAAYFEPLKLSVICRMR